MKLSTICFNIYKHKSRTYVASPKQHMYLHFPDATDFAFQVRFVLGNGQIHARYLATETYAALGMARLCSLCQCEIDSEMVYEIANKHSTPVPEFMAYMCMYLLLNASRCHYLPNVPDADRKIKQQLHCGTKCE